jgi:hypothetical protein
MCPSVEGALASLLRNVDAASSAARINMIVDFNADTTRPAETFLGPDRIGRKTVSSKNDTDIRLVIARREAT